MIHLDLAKELAATFGLPMKTVMAVVDTQAKLVVETLKTGKETGEYKKIRCPHLGTFSPMTKRLEFLKKIENGTICRERRDAGGQSRSESDPVL